MDSQEPPQIPNVKITDKNDSFHPVNAFSNAHCLIKEMLLPNLKNVEVLNHGRDGPLNIYLFKLTLQDNNVFFQGLVLFESPRGFEFESMMIDKELGNLVFFYRIVPFSKNYTDFYNNLMTTIRQSKLFNQCMTNPRGILSLRPQQEGE